VNPEDFKQVWQSQTAQSRVTIDTDLLLREVQRNQRYFTATIFWRDVREIGVGLVLIPVWLSLGINFSLPWTWYLTVPGLVWIVVFMLLDRLRQRQRSPEPADSLTQRLEGSLAQVVHQIWLLRNILWWYLLPLGVPMLAFVGQVTLQTRTSAWATVTVMIPVFLFAGAVFAFAYWLNQYAVRTELEPRRQELEMLLSSLREERTGSD
jgi:hypothetical protein